MVAMMAVWLASLLVGRTVGEKGLMLVDCSVALTELLRAGLMGHLTAALWVDRKDIWLADLKVARKADTMAASMGQLMVATRAVSTVVKMAALMARMLVVKMVAVKDALLVG